MKVLKDVLNKYKNKDFIDINSVVKDYWLKIVEWDLGDVYWILYKNIIWVKKNIDVKNQRFIIAHEFCHFLLKEKSFSTWIYNSSDFIEKRADKFATHILLPKKVFIENYNQFWNIPTLSEMFWVPVQTVEMRLNNLLNN